MELHLNSLAYKAIGLLLFRLVSPLNIGLGGEGVRREFLTIPDGRLLIPASTWKGSFRHLTEIIARNTEFDDIADLAVRLYKETISGITYSEDRESFREYIIRFHDILRDANIREVLLELGYSEDEILEAGKDTEIGRRILSRMAEDFIAVNCPIGKLYGNRVIAGKVRFRDTLIKLDGERVRIHTRPGTGIDRKSGKVKEGVLYFIETIPPGVEIKLTIIADNLIPGSYESRLFASTLEALKLIGLSIGARKSAGGGHLLLDDAIFYEIDLKNDKEFAIGNPFKKAHRKTLGEFIEWLRR